MAILFKKEHFGNVKDINSVYLSKPHKEAYESTPQGLTLKKVGIQFKINFLKFCDLNLVLQLI